MKKLILATAVTAGVITYFMGNTDKPADEIVELKKSSEKSKSMVESTVTAGGQVNSVKATAETNNSRPSSSSDSMGYSSYNEYYNSTDNESDSSYEYSRYSGESNSNNESSSSSSDTNRYDEDYSSSDNNSSYGSSIQEDSNDNISENNDTPEEEKLPTEKFQRIYDDGIIWYGDYGTLNINYQSSNAETTGIGFRLHFDSASMRVIGINQNPTGALVMTNPSSVQADNQDKDNNSSTDQYLTFAWFDMNGQWPQSTQLNLATIEFEKLNNGINNFNIDYSVTSNSAGYIFVK
jgi:hypothetical protein